MLGERALDLEVLGERESTRSRCVRREREIGQTQLGVSAFTAMQRGWEGEREH